MSMYLPKLLCLTLLLLCLAACSPTTGGEVSLIDAPSPDDESQAEKGEALEDSVADQDGLPDQEPETQNPDAAYFAEDAGISLAEANQRLAFQESIGDIQPQLMADHGDIFGGLWVEHQPVYRIVIALTEGDEETIRPYIEGNDWFSFVELTVVDYTLKELTSDQAAAGRAAQAIDSSVTTAVDVINNRVELMVGNPDIFQSDLVEAGIQLPSSVVISAFETGGDLPESNQGVLIEATTPDGRTIYLPKQAPSDMSMAALMEGQLIEINGCLRLTDGDYREGFLVIWRNDADIRIDGDKIEVLNGKGQPIAQVGSPLRAGGGAIESNYGRLDEGIPGMPIQGCPGPYWIIGEMETLSLPVAE